jgi:hypothetical protein
MKQKSHWMGSYWERVTTLVCDIVETCSVLVKLYLICFENIAVLFTCIFSIAITVVNNFNCTWYKIVQCRHFLQNKRIHLISFNFHRSYKLALPTSRIQLTGSALEHWHIMHCSQFNASFLLFGLEGESFKGLPNDAIIRNMNVSVRLNSGTTIT